MPESGRSVLDDIRALNYQRGPACMTGSALAAMDEAVADTVRTAYADRTIQRKAIIRWLIAEHKITLPAGGMSRHFDGECSCE